MTLAPSLTHKTFQRCIFLLLDGVRMDVLQDLVSEKKLPNIERTFFAQGSVRPMISVFPSTTGPAYLPFLTGCFPGTLNLPGIRWLDRARFHTGRWNLNAVRSYVGPESYLMNQDFPLHAQTLFEAFPKSASIFSVINRGVPRKGDCTKWLRSFLLLYAKFLHHWSLVDRVATDLMLRCLDQNPSFVFVCFLGVDEVSHLTSPVSKKTICSYKLLDQAVGRLVVKLEERRMWDSTLLLASSDHGLTQTTNHCELWKVLERRGLTTLYHPLVFRRNVQAACMVSGNAMAHVYVRNGSDWKPFTFHEDLMKMGLVDELLALSHVDQVITRREDGRICVTSANGKATLYERNSLLHYHVEGSDPFGFGTLPEPMTFAQALENTFDTLYPDALVQVAQLFRSVRTGDMVVTARKGSDLRQRFEIPKHYASHGSLHREHIVVPFLSNHRFLGDRPLRTVDVFPTILSCLGHDPSAYPIDGTVVEAQE